jgi:4-hydroxy-3-methylbut-2-enyl diphosphate reductase
LTVLLASPRGFCAGVVRAIDAVRDALRIYGAPVYVRRPIVHNLEVVRALEAEGAIFVEELDAVPTGGVVLFSAHGVAPAIARDARARGLIAFDAVCPLVAKVHREVERHHQDGRQVVIIGHAGHPEIEGTLGHLPPDGAYVISHAAQIADLPLRREDPVGYAVQTTYSVDDAAAIVDALFDHFSDIVGPTSSDICYATTNRQKAVRDLAAVVDAVIIVGENFSSNARRLAEVAAQTCPVVQLIADRDELDWAAIPPGGTIAVSAAASTPEISVRSVVEALGRRFDVRLEERGAAIERTVFRRLSLS